MVIKCGISARPRLFQSLRNAARSDSSSDSASLDTEALKSSFVLRIGVSWHGLGQVPPNVFTETVC
jgi:hypothetical protein